jgi:hypothetical protein
MLTAKLGVSSRLCASEAIWRVAAFICHHVRLKWKSDLLAISCDAVERIVAFFSRNRCKVSDVWRHVHDTAHHMTLLHARPTAICGSTRSYFARVARSEWPFHFGPFRASAVFVSEGTGDTSRPYVDREVRDLRRESAELLAWQRFFAAGLRDS